MWWRLRRFIRLNTRKVPEHQVIVWRKRLNYAYLFFTWNLLFALGYTFMKGKMDWSKHYGLEQQPGSPAQQFAYMMDIPRATVIQIDGFTKTGQFEIYNEKDVAEFDDFKLRKKQQPEQKNETVESELSS